MSVKNLFVCLAIFAGALSQAEARSRLRATVAPLPSVEAPRWVVRTAPIAFFASWVTLDLSYRLTERFTTGPAAVLYNSESQGGMLAPSYKGYALGWHANYNFSSPLRSGWYTSVHGYYETYQSFPHAQKDAIVRAEGTRANLVLGYRWRIKPFDILLGGGTEVKQHSVYKKRNPYLLTGAGPVQSTSETTELRSFTSPYLEFKVGFEI